MTSSDLVPPDHSDKQMMISIATTNSTWTTESWFNTMQIARISGLFIAHMASPLAKQVLHWFTGLVLHSLPFLLLFWSTLVLIGFLTLSLLASDYFITWTMCKDCPAIERDDDWPIFLISILLVSLTRWTRMLSTHLNDPRFGHLSSSFIRFSIVSTVCAHQRWHTLCRSRALLLICSEPYPCLGLAVDQLFLLSLQFCTTQGANFQLCVWSRRAVPTYLPTK